MADGTAKAALFDALASVAQALGSGRRGGVGGVARLGAAVRDVAVRHVAGVSVLADEYLGQRDGVEQLSAEELALRLERGDVVVLDVRPQAGGRGGAHT